jgi:prophage regulatory protein
MTLTASQIQPLRILRLPETLRRCGISRSQLYRLLDARDFPSRVPLGEKITGFVEHEVEAWIRARIARRAA